MLGRLPSIGRGYSVPSLGVRSFTMTKNSGHQYLGTWTLEVIIPPRSAAPRLAHYIAEGARWRSASLDLKPRLARKFYGVIAAAILIGLAFDLARLNAIRMLFLPAVLNGLLAPPSIIMVVLVTSDRRVMGNRS